MEMLSDIILLGILRTNEDDIVFQKENDNIEFKVSFNNDSKLAKAKYAKELAALYNFEGGYLIFGIDDVTNKLEGLENFEDIDNADLSNDINTYFSPAIKFNSKTIVIEGKTVFVIYVSKREGIPTICIKSYPDEIKESVIYWRYSAISAPVKSGDLINLLNSLQGELMKESAMMNKADAKARWKPKFDLTGSSSANGSISLHINNIGESAYIDNIEVLEGEILIRQKFIGYEIRKNKRITIPVNYLGNNSANLAIYKLTFDWHDEVDNRYSSIIEGKGGAAKIVNTEQIE